MFNVATPPSVVNPKLKQTLTCEKLSEPQPVTAVESVTAVDAVSINLKSKICS